MLNSKSHPMLTGTENPDPDMAVMPKDWWDDWPDWWDNWWDDCPPMPKPDWGDFEDCLPIPEGLVIEDVAF